MDLPELVESSGESDPLVQEEAFVEGWRRRLVLRKGVKKQRRDVVYVAPDGTEVKNKKQLEKYLKKHPGGPLVSEFNWRSEMPTRLSRRLSNKGGLDDSEVAAVAELYDDQDKKTATLVSDKEASRNKAETEAFVGELEKTAVST
jgi:hypothetical protein